MVSNLGQRTLVAENHQNRYMCEDSISLTNIMMHVINSSREENQTPEWAMRLRVVLYIFEALDYCSREGCPLYHDLKAYRFLFEEVTPGILRELNNSRNHGE